MVESINHKVELTINGTSFLGGGTYGKLLLGDAGFEFFSDRNVRDYIQIPWGEINRVIVSFVFWNRWIPRFAIETKSNGTYAFASRDPKLVLRTVRNHIPAEHIVKSLSVWEVVKRSALRLRSRRKE